MKKQLSIFALILFSICNSFAQSDFSQWRGPDRDGFFPGSNLLTSWPANGPKLLWKYDHLGPGFSSPAVTDHRIYTAGAVDSTCNIFCFDQNGSLLWEKPLGRDFMGEYPGTYSTPVISGDLGYVTTSLGSLYCFSASNGSVVWSKDLIKEYNGTPVKAGFLDNLIVDGDILYCAPGGAGKNIVALNRRSGALIWASKGEREISGYGSPILIDHKGKKLYVYQDAGSILALNAADGTLVWRHPRNSETTVGTPLTGRTIGSIPTKAMVVTSIAADGLIYAYDIDGAFSLLKPVDSGLETVGSFAVNGGTKYHCSHPVISDGKLCIRHDNSLFVYDIAENEKSD